MSGDTDTPDQELYDHILTTVQRQLSKRVWDSQSDRSSGVTQYIDFVSLLCEVACDKFHTTRSAILERLQSPPALPYSEYINWEISSASSPACIHQEILDPTILKDLNLDLELGLEGSHNVSLNGEGVSRRDQTQFQQDFDHSRTTRAELSPSPLTHYEDAGRPRKRKRRSVVAIHGDNSELLLRPDVSKYFDSAFDEPNAKPVLLSKRLFCAFGSGEALRQWRSIIRTLEEQVALPMSNHFTSVARIWKALDALENHAEAGFIMRRLYLIQLVKRQVEIMDIVAKEDSLSTHHKEGRFLNKTRRERNESRVLNILTREAYPNHIDDDVDFDQCKTKVKNRIHAGLKWYRLQELYSLGVVVLLPSGPKYRVNSQNLESMKDSTFEIFVHALQEFRDLVGVVTPITDQLVALSNGRTLLYQLQFEVVSEEILRDSSLNDDRLRELCQPVPDNTRE